MSIRTVLSTLLEEYSHSRNQGFSGNSLARSLRFDLPEKIGEVIANSARYKIVGSPGKGNWADVPWIAVLDRFVTDTPRQGYYLVYLLRKDGSGIYLSLNQGVTIIRQDYSKLARQELSMRARVFRSKLGKLVSGTVIGPIELATDKGLGGDYQQGSVCAVLYQKGIMPSEDQLRTDLLSFLRMYRHLVDEEVPHPLAGIEEDELGLKPERLRKVRLHKIIERNRELVADVKKAQGYKCKACDFDFKKAYGDIGIKFIEAHHLIPLSKLTGDIALLDPRKDFSVLCSNCHRMIHRSNFVGNVKEFQNNHVTNADMFPQTTANHRRMRKS